MMHSQERFMFVAIGEGLAAGMGDFSLRQHDQRMSFSAQLATQLRAEFPQSLLRSPGIGDAPGFPRLPVIIPAPMQTRILEQMPPRPVSDLCVPGFTVADTLHLRPAQPLVHHENAKQTACNLIFGMDSFIYGEPGKTQLETALSLHPGLTLICLGYTEALEAAVAGDAARLPEPDFFRACYSEICQSLRQAGSELIVVTIPDPLDTAYFSSLDGAERVLKISSGLLQQIYGLETTDLITAHGLMEIGNQFFQRAVAPLCPGLVLKRAAASELAARIRELNGIIAALARDIQALLFDLHALFAGLRCGPIQLGSKMISADFLGGFYRLNGYFPGATGHALIANALISQMNREWSASIPAVDLQQAMAVDPAADYRIAKGRSWERSDLPAVIPIAAPEAAAMQSCACAPTSPSPTSTDGPLRLPDGLEQILPINSDASYFGDGLGAFNCRTERDMQWGNAGEVIFGGLAMVDSHLHGSLRIKFSPPVGNKTRFEISFLEGFAGEDAVLVTPQFFRMPFQHNRVDEVPGAVSSGVLDLSSGYVSDLTVYAQYASTALLTLVSVNPNWPKQPLSFPGPYGSAWARFDPRDDGKLDFTFYGSTYVPLGKGTRWPLPFGSADGDFATVPANGMVMHPHLHLSTRPPQTTGSGCPEIPYNTVQEYTLHTHNSAFGDQFTLNTSELGGPAKGRSHVMGRIQIQYGARTGNSVPVAITGMNAGGLFVDMADSPITAVFPSQLSPGPQGFYELLRFPLRTYSLDDLAIIDDPFDISVGLLDLNTGMIINPLLHRGFINQDLIFALLRVEPRTPKDSFYFRGPARLEKGPDGRKVFRFNGIVRVPYPAGFLFPTPNLTTGLVVGPDSVLDPFLWFQAMENGRSFAAVMEGEQKDVIASIGDRFSYRFRIGSDSSRIPPVFEYQNHTQNGSFSLHSLAWVSLTNSRLAREATNDFDTLTFTGFGVWRKDGLETIQQATVQITTAPDGPYVGIQIANSEVSNVNTKPQIEATALP